MAFAEPNGDEIECARDTVRMFTAFYESESILRMLNSKSMDKLLCELCKQRAQSLEYEALATISRTRWLYSTQIHVIP